LQTYFLKPLGFGATLDRSFQLYRKHFAKLMILSLILLAPIYLLQAIFFYDSFSDVYSLDNYTGGNFVDQLGQRGARNESPLTILLLVFVLGLISVAIVPIAIASVVFLVDANYKGETMGVGDMLKRSFQRFWPLLGNSFLYMIIIGGIYTIISMVLGILIVLLILLGTLVFKSSFADFDLTSPSLILILIFLYIAVVLIISVLIGFFSIRWGYYLPSVAFGDKNNGIGRSWHLTKGSFWRLFAVYSVLSVIGSVIFIGYMVGLQFIPVMTLKIALSPLVNLLMAPLLLVVYAVSYFDLSVRKEGLGVEVMLKQLVPEQKERSEQSQPLISEQARSWEETVAENDEKRKFAARAAESSKPKEPQGDN
jgi:hypothetical protein